MKYALLFLATFYVALALDIEYSGNISLGEDFFFRRTVWNPFGVGAAYSSVEVKGTSNDLDVNGLFGAAYAVITQSPGAYLAFFDLASDWTHNGDFVNGSVNAAASVIANSYIALQERTPAGDNVDSVALKSLLWAQSAGSPLGTGGLRFITLRGKKLLPLDKFEVKLTFVTSDVVGVLKVPGNPIVTPKSFEIVLEINDYNYKNAQNHLVLHMGVGTASGTVDVKGSSHVVSTGSGASAAYFSTSKTAQVDGAMANVDVKFEAATSTQLDNAILASQISGKFGGNAEFKLVTVAFPAGAKEIVYDPSIGAGSSFPESDASVARLSIAFLFSLIALALIM